MLLHASVLSTSDYAVRNPYILTVSFADVLKYIEMLEMKVLIILLEEFLMFEIVEQCGKSLSSSETGKLRYIREKDYKTSCLLGSIN